MAAMTWMTARELAGMPGMPSTVFGTRKKLAKLGVPSRARSSRGGGQEYDCTALPEETRAALLLASLDQAAARVLSTPESSSEVFSLCDIPSVTPISEPTTTQLVAVPSRRPPSQADHAVADARLLLVNQVFALEHEHGVKRACALVSLQLASGQASETLQVTARTANQRARTDAVSARTLERWLGQFRAHGWWGLLPVTVEIAPAQEFAADVSAVLGLYHSKDARFRKLTDCAKEVNKELGRAFDAWHALYSRARRALEKVDKIRLIKARHSGAQRAAMLPYKKRDTSVLRPLDVCLIDGHTFKAKVRHPDHGAPFAPELTLVIDAATRMICGWSVSLSENVVAVGDALRHAVGQHGVWAVIYTDNGPGETAKHIDCPIHGFAARLGSDHRTGIPGHPQGHGLIERSWQTHAIRCARQFGSYQGSDVDSGTFRKVASELAREQRAVRRAEQAGDESAEVITLSPKAPSWRQFIEAVERMVHEYNHEHRHRSLPKNDAGKHMTPAEAWEVMLDPEFQFKMSAQELRLMFMPAVKRQAKRGQVTLFNQDYQAPELMAMGVDGHDVSVRFDIHDPNQVLIYDLDGNYICEARWNANRIDYFPKPVIEIAQERRKDAAKRRLQQKMDLVEREGRGPLTSHTVFLPEPGTVEVLVPTLEAATTSSLPSSSSGEVVQAASGRPFFDAPSERYEWLMRNRDQWGREDVDWLDRYVNSEDYEDLSGYYAGRGMAWSGTGTQPECEDAHGLAATKP